MSLFHKMLSNLCLGQELKSFHFLRAFKTSMKIFYRTPPTPHTQTLTKQSLYLHKSPLLHSNNLKAWSGDPFSLWGKQSPPESD